MDRIDAMRLFARVVERRSFTLAAQDLTVPRSTATEVVKQLEARLGVRLLQRTTRHVAPTLDGDAYYRHCLKVGVLPATVLDRGWPSMAGSSRGWARRRLRVCGGAVYAGGSGPATVRASVAW
jgi:DNA-binding transcriptional LysR family regulator